MEAPAPLLFGFLSTQLGGGGGSAPPADQPHGAAGLDHTFLIMVGPLVAAAGLLLLAARRTYPRDLATALASEPPPASGQPVRGSGEDD